MKIRVSDWNAFVNYVFRHRVATVTRIAPEPWRHPWWTTAAWSPDRGEWVCRIKPGYVVRGLAHQARTAAVSVRVPLGWAPQSTLTRLGRKREMKSRVPVDAWLREEPEIALPAGRWRRIGTDAGLGESDEPVPRFFRKRGVNEPGDRGFAEDGGLVHRRPRLLRAMDIVLHADRLANATDWRVGTGVEGRVAEFYATVASRPDREALPYLRTLTRFVADEAVDPLVQIQGGWQDSGTDRRLVATVYLLSDPGLPPGSDPERQPGRWRAHVRHRLFWNLRYVETRFEIPAAPTPLQVPGLSLAGGLVGSFTPAIAEINDRYAALTAYLGTQLARGIFVTL